jgi:hypothetical protein
MSQSKRAASTLLVASLTLAISASAQERKPAGSEAGAAPMTPTPSKELETWMKPLEGSWNCETKMMAGAMGPGSAASTMKSTVKFSKDKETNGMWHRGEYSMPKTKGTPAMTGYFLLSHDDAHKQLAQVSWDSAGGASMGTGTISGETMIWTSDGISMGQKMKSRDTLTKTGPKTITHKMEADTGKGFAPMGEDTCTKQGST